MGKETRERQIDRQERDIGERGGDREIEREDRYNA